MKKTKNLVSIVRVLWIRHEILKIYMQTFTLPVTPLVRIRSHSDGLSYPLSANVIIE